MSFFREALLYDIKNVAYVTADIMPVDDDHQKHQVFDVGEDGNVDRVTRIMNLAFAEVVEWLYRFTKLEVRKGGKTCSCSKGSGVLAGYLDNEFEEPDEYVLMMRIPSNFSHTTLHLLKELIHEYIVCRVLEDWLSITDKADAEVWRVKREEVATKIKTYRNMGKKVRISLHPRW